VLAQGSTATFAIWLTGEPTVDDGAGLPDVAPGTELPTCLRTVVRGQTIYSGGPVGG
jgi:hypothetical protein